MFTTQSLLGALGVAGRYSGEAAAAINWVIKDGAGRLGRLLFARWGRELDCELKQFRLMGERGGGGGGVAGEGRWGDGGRGGLTLNQSRKETVEGGGGRDTT